MKISNLTVEEVLYDLNTPKDGLADSEAQRRLVEFGYNEIEETKKKPLILRFFDQFTHFLAVLLWIATLLAFLSDFLHPGEGMLTLGIAIVVVIFINAIFTFVQEYRAEKALKEMKKLLPFYVNVMREGMTREIHAREVVPGDVIFLAEGDRIPADLRLIEAHEIKVNNASLTGESDPIVRGADPFPGDIISSPNIAFAGTTVISGSGTGVAFATGMRTEFGRVAHLTGAVTSETSPLQKEIIKITRIIAILATIMGIVFFFVGHLIGRTFWENFLFAIGIIVANVPEGLLPTVTLSLAMGSQRMAKRNALIKKLISVETLGSVSVICTDKTGTLTLNKMSTRRTISLNEHEDLTKTEPHVLTVALLCNNTKEVEGKLKGDPTEVALYETAIKSIGQIKSTRLNEFPFDSERKRMSTVHVIENSTYVLTKGSPESILAISPSCLVDGNILPFDETLRNKAASLYQSMMDEGLRIIAFSYRSVKDDEQVTSKETAERDMIFLGLIGLEDPPRLEVPGAIKKCRDAGIKIIMITGDSSRTALAIAREIGLVEREPMMVESKDFLKMSDDELRKVLSHDEVIFSRMTPKHKLRVVNILLEEGERVAVTGDGVNDAPALKRADIGIAMGITGTDVAKEAADMILLDDNFATIVAAIEEGRAVYGNIRKFISYIFSSNIPEIIPYLAYALFRIPLPLTIMQILAVDLGTDMIPALALGAEKPSPGIMKSPPRSPKERLLNLPLLTRAYLFLGPIEAAAGLYGFFYVLHMGGWQWGQMLPSDNILYLQATTACLTAIIVTQIANVFACRSFKESVFRIGIFTNKLIFVGIAFEILLQIFIVYHPLGNKVFATYPIALHIWIILIPFALLLFFTEELRKAIVRKAK
jgi:sodium/potassium-transporting ATPase subunit alpha